MALSSLAECPTLSASKSSIDIVIKNAIRIIQLVLRLKSALMCLEALEKS